MLCGACGFLGGGIYRYACDAMRCGCSRAEKTNGGGCPRQRNSWFQYILPYWGLTGARGGWGKAARCLTVVLQGRASRHGPPAPRCTTEAEADVDMY